MLKPNLGLQSSGKFPLTKGDWGAQLGKYEAHLADPKNLEAYEAAKKVGPAEIAYYLDKHNLLEGQILSETLKKPGSAILQKRVPNAIDEWRVHSLHGKVPNAMTAPRHSVAAGAKANLTPGDKTTKQLGKFVEKTVKRLPKEYREGYYGFDVMRYKDPVSGKVKFKILESNPAEMAGVAKSPGGGSGFLDTSVMPWAAHAQHRAVTGRHTLPISIATGLGTGGLTAAGSAAALRAKKEQQGA
jgi:hypothetical protein